jgi:ppGpp synthetase/RelA/SpoT-type nucleotidyltranferase
MSDLRERYLERVDLLDDVGRRLEAHLLEHFDGRPHIDRISVRVKGLSSFLEKATGARHGKPYEDPLAELEDQVAGRIIVFFTSDIAPTVEHLGGLLNRVEVQHKRPTKSNEFDYESWHGVYTIPSIYLPEGWEDQEDMPETLEMQVRTLFQHAYAEPQHDLGYKPGASLADEVKRELAWVAASSWGADQALDRVRKKLASSN